jgi:hypothetical protein
MNKNAYLLLGLAAVVLAGLGYFLYLMVASGPTGRVDTNTDGTPYTDTTYPVTTNQPGGSTISIASKYGQPMTVRDFKSDPTVVKDVVNEGHYFVGGHFSPTEEGSVMPPYAIEYIDETQYFSIVLLEEPLKETRLSAEKFLMERLGISKSQMCQLRYMVSVPVRVNPVYAGTDLLFSFCKGAATL